jgi:hypothetical protein
MRLTLVTAVLLLFAGAASASADQGEWILPPRTLPGSPAPYATSPVVAVGPGKTATVVWRELQQKDPSTRSDNAFRIRATTRPESGRFLRPVTLLNAPTTTTQGLFEPVIASGSAGTLVSWLRLSEGKSVEYRFRPKGGKFGPVRTLSRDSYATGLVAAQGPDGTLALAWASDDGVHVAVRKPRTGFGDPVTVAEENPSELSDLAVAPNRTTIATWVDYVNGESKARAAVLRQGEVPGPVLTLANRALSPKIAFSPTGEATAVWHSNVDKGIHGAYRRPGRGFGETFKVSRSKGAGQASSKADLVMGRDGRVTVAYLATFRASPRHDYSTYRKQFVTVRSPGGRLEHRALGGSEERSASASRIVASNDGTVTVLWIGGDEPGMEAIYASTRPRNGSFPPRPALVSKGKLSNADLAAGPDGSTVAVWAVEGQRARLRTASTRP